MPQRRLSRIAAIAALVVIGSALSGCNQKSAEPDAAQTAQQNQIERAAPPEPPVDHELAWARTALERNPNFEVLAVDAGSRTLQVRVKATNQIITLKPNDIAAVPLNDVLTAIEALAAQPESKPEPKPEYKVEREDGRVRVSGPGVSIESSAATPEKSPRPQRFDEPIVCDGKRLLRVDGQRLNVQGDAITLSGGCELHLANSQITATGTAIVVLNATAHIANSEINGADGSLTASSAARVVLRATQFKGMVRRDPQAAFQDQGGNSWR